MSEASQDKQQPNQSQLATQPSTVVDAKVSTQQPTGGNPGQSTMIKNLQEQVDKLERMLPQWACFHPHPQLQHEDGQNRKWEELLDYTNKDFQKAITLVCEGGSIDIPETQGLQLQKRYFEPLGLHRNSLEACLHLHLGIITGLSKGVKIQLSPTEQPATQAAAVNWIMGQSGSGKSCLQRRFIGLLQQLSIPVENKAYPLDIIRSVDFSDKNGMSLLFDDEEINPCIFIDEALQSLNGIMNLFDTGCRRRWTTCFSHLVNLANIKEYQKRGMVVVNIQKYPALILYLSASCRTCRDMDHKNDLARFTFSYIKSGDHSEITNIPKDRTAHIENELITLYQRILNATWPTSVSASEMGVVMAKEIQAFVVEMRGQYSESSSQGAALHRLLNRAWDSILRYSSAFWVWYTKNEDFRAVCQTYQSKYYEEDLTALFPQLQKNIINNFCNEELSCTSVFAMLFFFGFQVWWKEIQQYIYLTEQLVTLLQEMGDFRLLGDLIKCVGKIPFVSMLTVEKEDGEQSREIQFTVAKIYQYNKSCDKDTLQQIAAKFQCIKILEEGIKIQRNSSEAVSLIPPNNWGLSNKQWRLLKNITGKSQIEMQSSFTTLFNTIKTTLENNVKKRKFYETKSNSK